MRRIIYILTVLCFFGPGQLAARSVYNINARWSFFTGNDTDTGQASVVYLPHTWNGESGTGGIGGTYYRGVGNYMKDIDIPAEWSGHRIFLRVGGAATVADIMINGRYVADNHGGNSAFTVEITDKLRYGHPNKFWIIVNNSPVSDVLPIAGEANVYGGLFRSAELIVADPLSVAPDCDGGDGVWITTTKLSANKAEGIVKLKLLGTETFPENARARIRFTDADEKVVAQNSAAIVGLSADNPTLTLPFSISKPRLWQGTADPHLYNVEITLTTDGDLMTDSITVRTGLRTFGKDADNNFLLNGKPYRLRGVTLHRDRMIVGTAVTPFQIEEDVEMIREIGANAVRVAGGQHNDYFYSLCDEAGLVVWNDMPFTGAAFPTDRDFPDSPRFRENGEKQLREMINQLYNHPSVALWGIFSDLSARGDDPIPYIRGLNALAHSIDPTRLTVASSIQDGEINFITDFIVFNHSFGWTSGMPSDISVWMEQIRRNWSNLPAGITYSAGGSIFQHSEKLERPEVHSNRHPENWQTFFHEEYMRLAADAPQFWGVFVGNMFDFGSARRNWGDGKGTNDHGLATFDRKDRKDAYYVYKANWNRTEPFVYIAGKRLDTRGERRQTVKVYSNQPEVELFMGNRSLGKRSGNNGIFTWENVELRNGVNRLEARSAGVSDRASINIDSSGGAAARPLGQTYRIANQ